MKKMNKSEAEKLLSQYIDGELDEFQRRRFEESLAEDDDLKQEYELLLKQKKILSSHHPLPADEWFWGKLAHRLRKISKNDAAPIHIPNRSFRLVFSIAAIFFLITGVGVFDQWDKISSYFAKKKSEVEQVYRAGFLQGSIVPLFSRLNNDEVLQFAVSGSIPIDSAKNSELRIDPKATKGYRIEFIKTDNIKKKNVTVRQFCEAVGVNADQQRTVDSILQSAGEKIRSSALMGDNNTMAIGADLVGFHQQTMSRVVAILNRDQRRRFQEFLVKADAPYRLNTIDVSAAPHHPAIADMRHASRQNKFFVITPDTLMVTELDIDLDSLRKTIEGIRPRHFSNPERAEIMIRQFNGRKAALAGSELPFNRDLNEDNFGIEIPEIFGDFSNAAAVFRTIPRTPQIRIEVRSQGQRGDITEKSIRVFTPALPSQSNQFQIFLRPVLSDSALLLLKQGRINLDSAIRFNKQMLKKSDDSLRQGTIEL